MGELQDRSPLSHGRSQCPPSYCRMPKIEAAHSEPFCGWAPPPITEVAPSMANWGSRTMDFDVTRLLNVPSGNTTLMVWAAPPKVEDERGFWQIIALSVKSWKLYNRPNILA